MKEQRHSSGSEIGESERPNFVSLLEKIEKGENLSRQEEADFWNLLGNKIRRMASFYIRNKKNDGPFVLNRDKDDILNELVQRVFYLLLVQKGNTGDHFAIVREVLKEKGGREKDSASVLDALLSLKVKNAWHDMREESDPLFFLARRNVLRSLKDQEFALFSLGKRTKVSLNEGLREDTCVLPFSKKGTNPNALPHMYTDEDLERLSLNPSGKKPTQRDIVGWFFEEVEEGTRRVMHAPAVIEIIFQALRKHPEYRQFISLFVLCKAVHKIQGKKREKSFAIRGWGDEQQHPEADRIEKEKIYKIAMGKVLAILEEYQEYTEEQEGKKPRRRAIVAPGEKELCQKIIETKLQYLLGLDIDAELPKKGILYRGEATLSFSRLYASFTGGEEDFEKRMKDYRKRKIRQVVEYLWSIVMNTVRDIKEKEREED